jgi:hypothetical protein
MKAILVDIKSNIAVKVFRMLYYPSVKVAFRPYWEGLFASLKAFSTAKLLFVLS